MGILDRHEDKWHPEPNSGCFIWTGSLYPTGYPRVGVYRKYKRVSRIVCEETNGPPPTNKHEAAHKRHCGNKLCVNGQHIYWATRSQNCSDKPIEVRLSMSKHANDIKKVYLTQIRRRDIMED